MGVKTGHKVVNNRTQCYALTRYLLLPLFYLINIYLNIAKVVEQIPETVPASKDRFLQMVFLSL